MSTDADRLGRYVATWKECVGDLVRLLETLGEEHWSAPTDLPGWDVRAVVAHLAHVESELAAGRSDTSHGDPQMRQPSPAYTQPGVSARASSSPAELVEELVSAVEMQHAALTADPPTDGSGAPPVTPGGVPWDWETLLRNRVLDVWMHEQDVRRAVGRPGGLNSGGATHTATVLAMSLPYCVGKRVAPPAGTTVVLDVSGAAPVHLAVEVGADGRARALTAGPARPTASLRMDLETFVVLAGGRRSIDQVTVEYAGDSGLARAVAENLCVTP
jgi:uncharacterized protein (TIGR03083 family)